MSIRKQRAVASPSPDVDAAAEEVLRKGNAVDAVIAAVFAAAALSPGVLLGPVQLLLGGGGAGLRAFDGRVRQPGIGAPRPRGFMKDEEIPSGARVGVPWLPATLSAALATAGTATLAQVLAPGIALAKGSPRAEVLARLAGRGPRALEERPISSELLAVAGRPNGGLLTTDDLASPRPEVSKAQTSTLAGPMPDSMRAAAVAKAGGNVRVLVTLPWAHIEDGAPLAPVGVDDAAIGGARVAIAVDRNGTFALACWDEGLDGHFIDELGLRAPYAAEPVLRGQTRIRPGDARPAAAPLALVGSAAAPEIAVAAYGARDAYVLLGAALRGLVREERLDAHGDARLAAVSHVRGTASVVRS
jgi:gamma-glutamyltranspeptidase/glutathione hydrolase